MFEKLTRSRYLTENVTDELIRLENLVKIYDTGAIRVMGLKKINLTIHRGEFVAIMGHSGSGKSTLMNILGCLDRPTLGHYYLDGIDTAALSPDELSAVRNKKIGFVFQSFNLISRTSALKNVELPMTYARIPKRKRTERAMELLECVGLEKRAGHMPNEMSGGQRQRVMIAMALVCNPKILIADEPTTALDVTIQAQIIDLMNHLKKEIGTSIMFITHDLGVVAETCDEVVVMYCGRVVEKGNVYDIFGKTAHPYTQGLLKSIPKLGEHVEELDSIPGNVPNPKYMPKGCKFAPRCAYATERCKEEEPGFFDLGNGHQSRCWLCDK